MALIYEIEGQQVEVDKELTEAEIDEIAANIRSSVPQPEAPQRSTLQNIGRQIGLTGRGVAQSALGGFGVADLLIDPLQAAAGMETTAQGRERLLDTLGFPRPEGRLEENVQTGLDVMTSIGGQVRAAQELTRPLVGLLQGTGTTQRVALTVGDDLAQQLAAGVPAAMLADQVAVAASESGADPLETGALALSAGLLAGLTGAKAQRRLTREKVPLFTPEMAKNQARESYTKVKEAGVSLKPASLRKVVDEIEGTLKKAEGGFYPDALPEHGKVKGVLDSFRQISDSGPISFETLDKLRSDALSMARESTDPSTRRLMGQVVEGIDIKMSSLQPSDLQSGGRAALGEALSSVREARNAWRRSAKATVLEDALEAATRRGVAPTGKEGEIIRKNFENLYANKKKMKLFTKEEQEAIKRVAAGGKGLEQLLNFTSRFNPLRGTLPALGTAAGIGINPAFTGSLAATGIASDIVLTQMQRNAAKNVMSQIASGNIPRPRSNQAWRALVEAEMQTMQSMTEEQ